MPCAKHELWKLCARVPYFSEPFALWCKFPVVSLGHQGCRVNDMNAKRDLLRMKITRNVFFISNIGGNVKRYFELRICSPAVTGLVSPILFPILTDPLRGCRVFENATLYVCMYIIQHPLIYPYVHFIPIPKLITDICQLAHLVPFNRGLWWSGFA